MNNRSSRRSYAAPPPSIGAVQSKLLRIVCSHEQLKVSFHQLNSQIRTGLLEAEDVFVSLALQLMNLVGLKTDEMAADRRFTTIFTSVDRSHSQEENYMNKAMQAANELIERQKLQLMQLITVLRKIEAQVNSSQNSINQNLADHQAFMKKFFLKAFSYVYTIHHSGQSNDLSRVMLKILKATFDHVGAALGSVEAGIDDLIYELADKMCSPMVEYVKGLKVEMKNGTSSCLLEVVKEMHEAMQVRVLELEEARYEARLAQESRVEVLSRLMKSEETAKKLTISLRYLTEDNTGPVKNSTQEKSSSMKEDKAKDDNLLWELLQKKRKSFSDSPSKKNIPSITRTPITHSQSKRPHLQSSSINSRMLLCSSPSPSATTHKPIRGKLATP
ncbi:hypothetical protein ACS0TY_029301 [Phlomoides rotata]